MRDSYHPTMTSRGHVVPVRGADDAAGPVRRGELGVDDATHQALANAWPRDFFGAQLAGPEEGFAYLASQVRARGLPFDRDKVNIIGIRGMQGGAAHAGTGAFMSTTQYDDTCFVAALDENGQPMLREFRGTTDPGGRPDHARDADPRSQQLEADQQSVYRLSLGDTSKLGRPTITPRTVTEGGDGAVVAPGITDDGVRPEPEVERGGRHPMRTDPAELAHDPSVADPAMRDRQRTVTGDGRELDRSHGIAIHSGAGGDQVNGDSTGCQVIAGDWYGSFVMTLRRALDCRRVREERAAGGTAERHGDAELPESGFVLYSLLEAEDLARGQSAVRGAIDDERAAHPDAAPMCEPADAVCEPVQADGGALDGDVHARAQAGVSGSGSALPHGDRIQASFGHHDISDIRAFIGGPAESAARSIGAQAYATGDAVAFAGSPDLRQASHEAAHVVQQRAGVQLDGGVGEAGDRYEQHADDVAAAVVRGESAEALLDPFAPRGAAGGPAVQRIAEPLPDLQAAVDAVADPADLQATIDAIASHRRYERDQEYEIPIGGVTHRVHGYDLGALQAAVQMRRTRRGAPTAVGHRTAEQVELLVRDTVRAIAENESRGAPVAPESAMHTAAGPSASYGSATQATAAHATYVLGGGSAEVPDDARTARREYRDAHGIDRRDLRRANGIERAATAIWDAIVLDGTPITELDPDELHTTGFTQPELQRLARFGEFRTALLATRPRYQELLHSEHSAPAAGRALAREVMQTGSAIQPIAAELGFSESDVAAYIHEGRYNRFPEDRNAWHRVALSHHTEDHGTGDSPRTLDAMIESAAEADAGWGLSAVEYAPMLRSYIASHPDATDEQVVRYAAGINGTSADYPDRIWRHFQTLRTREATDTAAAAPH
jgi:hypothetical protein